MGNTGDMHYDYAETCAQTHGGGNIDLLTMAIHELGHSLGLRHSNVGEAIMYPSYTGVKRTLADDDIQGIQSICREPEPKLSWIEHLIRWIRKLLALD